MQPFERTERTTLRRIPGRGSYDRALIASILDEALVCHVGFVAGERPYVIPTTFARIGDRLYLHGAAASRMLKTLSGGVAVCVTVTLLDGLVLARSAFHHSMNYRSVVVLGTAVEVAGGEKQAALEAFVARVRPQRGAEVRPPSPKELGATSVLAIDLCEVSAKVRTGPPKDDEEDLSHPVWAGEIPLRLVAGAPVPDDHTSAEARPAAAPDHLLPRLG